MLWLYCIIGFPWTETVCLTNSIESKSKLQFKIPNTGDKRSMKKKTSKEKLVISTLKSLGSGLAKSSKGINGKNKKNVAWLSYN